MNLSQFKKIGYLGFAKAIDMVSSLLAYGWIIRKIETHDLGNYFLYLSFIQLLIPIFNLSIDISGIRTLRSEDFIKNPGIFFYSITFQRIIMFLVFITILFVTGIIVLDKESLILLILSSWPIIWVIIYPIWYYQGINKEHYALISIILYKIPYLILVFFFIEIDSPVYLIPLLNYLCIGIVTIFVFFTIKGFSSKEIMEFRLVSFAKENSSLILTQFITTGYTSVNRLLIGNLLSYQTLVLYDFVEKVLNILKQPLLLIVQAIFPEMINTNEMKKKNVISRITIITVTIVIISLIFSSSISKLIGGIKIINLGGDSILQLALPLVIITTLSASYSSFYLLTNKKYGRYYFNGITIGVVTFYILIFIFLTTKIYNLKQHFIILYIVETLILIYFFKKSYEIINNNFRSS